MAAIDRTVINTNGVSKTLSKADWLALPLVERVGLLRGDIQFFAGSTSVPAKEAVAELR
jgi:hypothetical protein